MSWRDLELNSTDAARNLAAEQALFDTLPAGESCFLLWQNRSAVIIGRYQDTAAEINADFVARQGIQVVRRLSGGGAVYHDLGNLNFSFITDDTGTAPDLRLFCLPVLRTLRALGVEAELSGRNDITLQGRKFSGNAQYRRGGRVLHHGTILFDSALDTVAQALRPDPEKLRARAVASVRSRVTNLRPWLPEGVTLADFKSLLLAEVRREHPGEHRELTAGERERIETLRRERYARWDWNYGASPDGAERRRRIEGCGTVSARLTLRGGCLAALRFRGDFFSPGDPEALERRLIGCRLERESLEAALAGLDPAACISGLSREALLALLLDDKP